MNSSYRFLVSLQTPLVRKIKFRGEDEKRRKKFGRKKGEGEKRRERLKKEGRGKSCPGFDMDIQLVGPAS